jgi:ribosomal protein L11 methyltransferase
MPHSRQVAPTFTTWKSVSASKCRHPQSVRAMDWHQFVMDLESIEPALAEQAFESLGAQSITLSDAGDDPVLEPAPGETPLWHQTRITALFTTDTDFDLLRRQLKTALALDALPYNYDEELEDRAWEREWLKDFRPIQFGDRLWVSPAGMKVPADDAVIVELDPGLAFGTGTHPTTALCLEWLDQHDVRGASMLDLGCGSGILAIAAVKLGAAVVDAIDIDLQAITATRQNAERNGVSGQIRTAAELATDEGPFDIIVANILAGTLIGLADEITGCLKPGGLLVLSGILSGQAEKVVDTYQRKFNLEEPTFLNGWTRISGTRH